MPRGKKKVVNIAEKITAVKAEIESLTAQLKEKKAEQTEEDKAKLLEAFAASGKGIDEVIADAYNVDVHLAHTYLDSNHDGCQSKDFCLNAYNSIAVELMRAMNFYRFNNPDSNLSDIWIAGGGAAIAPLISAISETLDMEIHDGSELIIGGDGIEKCHDFLQAIGIALY